MAKIDLMKLSDAELDELADAIAQEQARRHNEAWDDALAQINALAASMGMTVEEILARQKKPRVSVKGVPKYRNPDDPSQTWTGKGQRPGWFVEAQERGITREDMLI